MCADQLQCGGAHDGFQGVKIRLTVEHGGALGFGDGDGQTVSVDLVFHDILDMYQAGLQPK